MINEFRIVNKETGKFVKGFTAVPIHIDCVGLDFQMNKSALAAHKEAEEYLAATSERKRDKYRLEGRKVEVSSWVKIR